MEIEIISSPEFQRAFFMYQYLMPDYSGLNDPYIKETFATFFPQFRNLIKAGAMYVGLGERGYKEFWEGILGKKRDENVMKIMSLLEGVPVQKGLPKTVLRAIEILKSKPVEEEFKKVFGVERFPRKIMIGVRRPFAAHAGKYISGGSLPISKGAFIGIEVGGNVRPEEIADTLVHELAHSVLDINGYKNKLWPGSKFEERLLDWFAPGGFISESLGLNKRREPEKTGKESYYKEWAERLDPLMREYKGGNVFKFLYNKAGDDFLWKKYKRWYDVFKKRARGDSNPRPTG